MKILCLVLLIVRVFAEKVLIITSAYNRPEFIEIQHRTFNKFLKDEYEFVVFNDAAKSEMKHEIENTCSRLGVRCINIPQNIHNQPYLERWPGECLDAPAIRNANVVQYALNQIGFKHNGIVMIVDSDMFLVKEFSVQEFLHESQISGLYQQYGKNGINISYLWIGLVFLDMNVLPEKETINFNCGLVRGVPVDAGGYTYHYLSRHPEIKVKAFGSLWPQHLFCEKCKQASVCCTHNGEKLQENYFDNAQIRAIQSGFMNVEFLLQNTFLHYRGGTNWDCQTQGFHDIKTKILISYIQEILGYHY